MGKDRNTTIKKSSKRMEAESPFNPGMKVEVFEDPLTQKYSEGVARLDKRIAIIIDGPKPSDGVETWAVTFDGYPDQYKRNINRNQKPIEDATE